MFSCNLHFRQNDRALLCAAAVTQGWTRYGNVSAQKADPGEEILPSLQLGPKPKTFPPSCHCSPGSVVTYAFAKEYLLTASLSRLQVAGGGERPGHSDAGVAAVPAEEVPEEDDLQRRRDSAEKAGRGAGGEVQEAPGDQLVREGRRPYRPSGICRSARKEGSVATLSLVQFSPVLFRMVSTCLGKPICAPPCQTFTPVLPVKQYLTGPL